MARITDFKPGDTATLTRTFTAEDVDRFIALSGDDNPIHWGTDGIVHGLLTATMVSRTIGTVLPGQGAIWTHTDMTFVAPVRVGDTLTAKARVERVYAPLDMLRLDVRIYRQTGASVLTCKCTVRV